MHHIDRVNLFNNCVYKFQAKEYKTTGPANVMPIQQAHGSSNTFIVMNYAQL